MAMTARKHWHPSITVDRVCEAAEREMCSLDNPGFCLVCGEESDSCELDARNYRCEACGAHEVFSAAELVFHVIP